MQKFADAYNAIRAFFDTQRTTSGPLATNSTSTDGSLTLQGTNSVLRVTLASTSLSNAAQNTSLAATARPYSVSGWFDLAE